MVRALRWLLWSTVSVTVTCIVYSLVKCLFCVRDTVVIPEPPGRPEPDCA
jgi:hypothetical protein